MIREPYNINPYNSTIDTSRVNNFGFTFSGDELGSWKVEIAKNNTSPDIVYTSKEFFPEDVGYSRIFDSDIVEGTLLPSTVASGNGETDGLIRRIYSINGYPFNSSVVKLVLNEREDEPGSGIEITSIEGSSAVGGYVVVTSSSLGRDGENVKIEGYDKNAVQVGSTVTNGTFHFMGYVLTVEKNSAIQVGQFVEVENTILKIEKIDNSDNTYAQLYIAAGQDEVEIGESGVDVVSFDTVGEAKLTKLEVGLSSSQDLHGYDNPWVGGAGKNLCFLTDPELTVNTPQTLAGPNVLPSGTYTLTVSFDLVNATYSSGSGAVFNLYANGSNNYRTPSQCYRISDNKSMNQLTPPYTDRFWFRFTDIVNPSSLTTYFMSDSYAKWTGTMKNVQLEIGTTPTDFAPYSNICPIYPSNGKNLLPLNNGTYTVGTNVTLTINDGVISFDGTASSSGGRLIALTDNFTLKAGTYYIKTNRTNAQSTPVMYLNKVADNTAINGGDDRTFTLTEDTLVFGGINLDSGVNYTGATARPMLNVGSTATPYVPYQGINLYQVGKNFFNVESVSSITPTTVKNADGSLTVTGSRTGNNAYVLGNAILPKGTYTLSKGSGTGDLYFQVYANGGTIANTQNGDATFTLAEDTSVAFRLFIRGSVTYNNTIYPQCEKGSSTTAYEPYNGTTHSISLGRSVYGGYVDLVSGKLTIIKECVQITSDSGNKWYKSTSYPGGFYCSWTNLNTQFGTHFGSMANGYPIKCSHAKTASAISEYAVGTCYAETGNLNIRIMDSTADQATWRQYLVDQANNGTPIEVWANVGNPIEIDLTPQQIQTLLGTNNIWSSGNKINVLVYDYDLT